MIFRDILEKAIGIICDDEIQVDTISPKLNKLIRCGNMIYLELIEEYVRLKEEEEITFVDGKADFSSFSKLVKDVISVQKDGVNVSFSVYPNFVTTDSCSGKATVKYVYHGEELDVNDNVILPPQFTPYVLANGVASEYFYRSGLIDEAAFYKNRYDTSIINLTRKQKSIELKVKRFL
ncbi:MAG TPA: hypothetical protein VJ903_05835 [Clostridia bacterium]|nr:hypothetical protein [Clostridia bacterium]